ncbi:MAG: ELM1/GtrOC1 family putative glycosyltransferase, partial [Sphingomicrobium sp.]
GDNVLRLPLAMNRFRKPPEPSAEEAAWLERWPRPHLLLSLGGTAPMWRLDLAALSEALCSLGQRAARSGGTLIVIRSPRTPAAAIELAGKAKGVVLIEDGAIRYPVALADADEQFVTADSVSMISEAVLTGKPVGLIPVELDALGRRRIGRRDPEQTRIRDPRRFWADMRARGLVGTLDEPRRGESVDPMKTAAAAVRAILGPPFE